MGYKIKYTEWLEKAEELKTALTEMTESEIEDSFRCELTFGTGGFRGIIAPGTNRMNIYTVAKASQGLADFISEKHPDNKTVAVAYDSRNMSAEFAKTAAWVFAANGIKVFIYPELTPTPMLSFAVRYYKCASGIVITASHNPSRYNGYKVYGADGCQITDGDAAEIFAHINKLDIFADVKKSDFEEGIQSGNISYISKDCNSAFFEEVKKQSVLFGDKADRNACIVYTPLNGTGLIPVTHILRESGFDNINTVTEQSMPDGNFPTCPYPNPEIKEAMALGMEYANRLNADLLLATDPDSDRVGIAVRKNGEMILLSGNETGMLLFDYICSQRKKHNRMPEKPIAVKTIVTIDTAQDIARDYGVEVRNVLTGFKYIGEQIGNLEKNSEAERYIFGFEESYGYLSGSYVRDKDAVGATFLICEMFAFYKAQNIELWAKLKALYEKYGYRINTLHSYQFPGKEGFDKMKELMNRLRRSQSEIFGYEIVSYTDYAKGIDNLPKSDVIKIEFIDKTSLIVRPSGTEPKLKLYISVNGTSREDAEIKEKELATLFGEYVNQ